MSTTVAIDAMGGDFGPSVTVAAALVAVKKESDLNLILVGLESEIHRFLPDEIPAQITVKHATQIVEMDEPPAQAMRSKKDSSMRVAINLVKSGEADACVSAGNTGALMATSRFVLKTIRGIDRPAMITTLPSLRGHVHVLDLGANVDSPAFLLFQFAVMGSVLVKSLENIERPSIGLLNIGIEDIKGNNTVKEAARLIKASSLNYKGYVEGDSIYTGDLDVIVCDGFDGNVALKSSEGLAQMISQLLKESFNRNWLTRLSGLIAMPVMKQFKNKVDHRRYNGATFIGLRGIVVKSHGSADDFSFSQAIFQASAEAKTHVIQHLSQEIQQMMEIHT